MQICSFETLIYCDNQNFGNCNALDASGFWIWTGDMIGSPNIYGNALQIQGASDGASTIWSTTERDVDWPYADYWCCSRK